MNGCGKPPLPTERRKQLKAIRKAASRLIDAFYVLPADDWKVFGRAVKTMMAPGDGQDELYNLIADCGALKLAASMILSDATDRGRPSSWERDMVAYGAWDLYFRHRRKMPTLTTYPDGTGFGGQWYALASIMDGAYHRAAGMAVPGDVGNVLKKFLRKRQGKGRNPVGGQ